MTKRNNSYDWVHFSQSYLQIARLACQEILEQTHARISFSSSSGLKYNPQDLFISIVFNVKHGIEIFTKTLGVILVGKNEFNHDASKLFGLLKKEIKKHKIIEVIRDKHKEKPDDINLEFAYNKKMKISDFLDKLEKIIYKYHYCEVLLKKLNNGFTNKFTIEDVSNTAFRYPENNLKINPHYDEVLETITDDDIQEILDDTEILLKNFNDLGFIFDVYKQHAKN